MHRASILLATMLLLAGVSISGQVPWSVSVNPFFSIGGGDTGPDQELNRVSGAIRLGDGRVVVANGKPLELRIYSANGGLLKRIGRQGGGPGEFRGDLHLIAASGDSVTYLTSGTRRGVFRMDGQLVHEWTTPYVDRPRTTFYHRSFTRPPANGITLCTRQLIEALPVLPVPRLREVFTDDEGRNWVRPFDGVKPWTVYSPARRVLGTVTLPRGFDLYQAGSDYVLGGTRDENDFELVVAYRLSIPATARTARSPACAEAVGSPAPAAESPRASEFRVVLRNSMTAMEAAYFRSHEYPRTPDALRLDMPSKARFELLHVDDHGYLLGVFDLGTNLFCAVGVGAGTPPGWGEGELQCGN